MDKKILKLQDQFVQKYGTIWEQYPFPKFKWKQSYYDQIIRNKRDLIYHLGYIYFNPIKHKICKNQEELRNYKYVYIKNLDKFINNPDFLRGWEKIKNEKNLEE